MMLSCKLIQIPRGGPMAPMCTHPSCSSKLTSGSKNQWSLSGSGSTRQRMEFASNRRMCTSSATGLRTSSHSIAKALIHEKFPVALGIPPYTAAAVWSGTAAQDPKKSRGRKATPFASEHWISPLGKQHDTMSSSRFSVVKTCTVETSSTGTGACIRRAPHSEVCLVQPSALYVTLCLQGVADAIGYRS